MSYKGPPRTDHISRAVRVSTREEKAIPDSLVERAEFLRRCFSCRTIRVARRDGTVLWHADASNPDYECNGVQPAGGMASIPLTEDEWEKLANGELVA